MTSFQTAEAERTGDTPADTLTMTLFHSALRRDIARARLLLERGPGLSPRRARRLGRHLLWAMTELRRHHEGEDHDLWPLLEARAPEHRALFDELEAEHHGIDGPLLRLEAAARGLVAGRTAPNEALTALDELAGPLHDHLAREEAEGMAVASRVLTHREWQQFEQRAWSTGYTLTETLRFLTWMTDGVTWDRPLRRRAGLPAAVYWSIVRPLSAVARVPLLSVWAGTPAARIGSHPDDRSASA